MATREEVTVKIKKLLKLAESSNVNEAASAAAAAQGGCALIRVDNAVAVLNQRSKAVQDYMAAINLRLRSKGARARVSSGSGYHAGFEAGQQANIGSGARPLGAARPSLHG